MGHWYNKDGDSVYQVVGSKGQVRDTTLRDAKKEGYFPSVTSILAVEASPGLVQYKLNQLLDAAWGSQLDIEQIDFKEWKELLLKKSEEHAKNASDKGSTIHDALEMMIATNKKPKDKNILNICEPAIELLKEKFPNAKWKAEKSFTDTYYGFGGKVDLHDPVNNVVLDFKTKDTDDIKKMQPYDSHHMQTAAYSVGLFGAKVAKNDVKRYNLFISTQKEGLLNLTESVDFDRDWAMFFSLCCFWQHKNNHYIGDIFNETFKRRA